MKKYLENLNEEIKQYLKILSPEFPKWLLEYINTPEILRLDGIGQSCGTLYTKIYNDKYFYSALTHSIGVALIIWNFTHDKKQTIAGLFHDISSPAFKHCIDYLNGDAENQELTEEQTIDFIRNSEEIMKLLKRDEIDLLEVSDYKIYPIADNKMPKLSADRLEYTFMNGTYLRKVWDLTTIQEIYEDIEIIENEDNVSELGFKTVEIAEKFIEGASKLWPIWISSEDTITMYFLWRYNKKNAQ